MQEPNSFFLESFFVTQMLKKCRGGFSFNSPQRPLKKVLSAHSRIPSLERYIQDKKTQKFPDLLFYVALIREQFPMQTVKDVVCKMPYAKVFSVVDSNHGFWQVKLDKDSSKLSTFNTPCGRYSYKRFTSQLLPLK